MQNELVFSSSSILSFLLVLTRVSSVFTFVPMPGSQAGPSLARAAAAVGCTVALYSRWPSIPASAITPGMLIGWIVSEAAIGIFAGLAIGFLAEALQVGAQVLSLQAGYAYSSVIDPATQSDSGVLLVAAQLLSGLLFFAFGLDLQVMRALAASLESWPPGSFCFTRPMAQEIIRLAAGIFTIGFRIALPVTGLLIMVDLTLALLGRMHSQLQITILAFPLKMILALLLLVWTLALFPVVLESYARQLLGVVNGVLAH